MVNFITCVLLSIILAIQTQPFIKLPEIGLTLPNHRVLHHYLSLPCVDNFSLLIIFPHKISSRIFIFSFLQWLSPFSSPYLSCLLIDLLLYYYYSLPMTFKTFLFFLPLSIRTQRPLSPLFLLFFLKVTAFYQISTLCASSMNILLSGNTSNAVQNSSMLDKGWLHLKTQSIR